MENIKKEHITEETKPKSNKARFALVILAMGTVAMAGLYRTKSLKVNDVQFTGNHFSLTEELISVADIPSGVHPDSMDLTTIKNRIEALDYVDEVLIQVEPGGDLIFDIIEREPIGLLINGSDRAYLDKDGVILPIPDDQILDLPLVYGFNTRKDTLKSEAVKQISDFLQTAKTNSLHWITISEVAYSDEEGVVALSNENGVKLIFGNNNFDHKLANWGTFYTEVVRVKGMQSMRQIDLRFRNQVVTKEI